MILFLLACTASETDGKGDSDTAAAEVTDYQVHWSTDPDPLVAGEEGTFSLQVTDQLGRPIEDLQVNHERMVHTVFVSADWSTFVHTHHEDYADLTVDNVREASYEFPLTLPYAGQYFILFDFAHQDQWLQVTDEIVVTGAPAQADAPDTTMVDAVVVGDMRVSLSWDVPAALGIESAWSVTLTEGGEDVTDITQYLGADAHCAMVNLDNTWGSHTHAWFPGVTDMAPSMEMPHQYPGPTVPFHYVFPAAGTYKMWVQFARESAPGVVYTAPFVFEVGP